jgi:hypothetical protein
MEKNKSEMKKKVFLFHVDVLLEAYNKAMAQEALYALLKSDKVKFVQFESDSPESGVKGEEHPRPKKKENPKPANLSYTQIINQIEEFIQNNTLIRLSIVKSKGVKLSVPCRVLNYDDASQIVTIYHEDEKMVYQYSLNEIDDLIVNPLL